MNRANHYLSEGRHSDAIADYTRALALATDPLQQAAVLTNRGNAHLQKSMSYRFFLFLHISEAVVYHFLSFLGIYI
jgi:hypothetical protein